MPDDLAPAVLDAIDKQNGVPIAFAAPTAFDVSQSLLEAVIVLARAAGTLTGTHGGNNVECLNGGIADSLAYIKEAQGRIAGIRSLLRAG